MVKIGHHYDENTSLDRMSVECPLNMGLQQHNRHKHEHNKQGYIVSDHGNLEDFSLK